MAIAIERQYLTDDGIRPEPAEALGWARESQAQMVDLKFCDLLGTWQHCRSDGRVRGVRVRRRDSASTAHRSAAGRGSQSRDMLLMPIPSTAVIDPYGEVPTLSLICEIADPLTREPYARDPRGVATRAEEYLRSTGIADTAYFGPECEFFVFDEVSYELGPNRSHYLVDSTEGHWNSGKPGLGYTVREKEGYFPPAPHDTLSDLRTEMVLTLERLGIPCEFHHHEVASGGQCEIDLRFQTLTRMADQVMTYKYVDQEHRARRAGKTATFMPKPIFGDNGSGMHCHQSLWKDGETLMADPDYAGLSELHAPTSAASSRTRRRCSRCARRRRTRTAGSCPATRHPSTSSTRSATAPPASASRCTRSRRRRSAIEFRCPDPSANPYLAFAAMLMAGSTGSSAGSTRARRPTTTSSRRRTRTCRRCRVRSGSALDALEADHEFLLAGGVFSEDLIQTWIDYKRENEVDTVRLRPHPAEFGLYFDCYVGARTEIRRSGFPSRKTPEAAPAARARGAKHSRDRQTAAGET